MSLVGRWLLSVIGVARVIGADAGEGGGGGGGGGEEGDCVKSVPLGRPCRGSRDIAPLIQCLFYA